MGNCFTAVHSILKVNSYENASECIQYQLGATVCLWSSENCFQEPGEEDRHVVCALTSSISGGWYIYNYWKNIHSIFLRKEMNSLAKHLTHWAISLKLMESPLIAQVSDMIIL